MPLPAFRLGFVSVHVADLARARRFYEDGLGLRLVTEPTDDEAFYDLGGVPLSVHEDATGECGRAPGGPTGFYLQVGDLALALDVLRRSGVEPAWVDGRTAGVADPDGNELVVWEPKREWPPQG